MDISKRFEVFAPCNGTKNPYPKISRIIESHYGSRSHTDDEEVKRLIEMFKAQKGEYVVVITRTIEAVTCLILNAILEYESIMRDAEENVFHLAPSHINDDVRHGVDAIIYRRNDALHPPKMEPIAGIDFTVSNEQFKAKKKDVEKKWWTRKLYFNGSGGNITLPHIILFHHFSPILILMHLAETNPSIRNFQDLQSFISKSIKNMLERGYGWELVMQAHMNHWSRQSEPPKHIIAMNKILGRRT